MMVRNLSYVLLAGIFLVISASVANAAVKVTAVLDADPSASKGSCPAVITFKGKITVTALLSKTPQVWPVEVQYRFKRSDGAADPNIKTLKFMQPGSMDVSTTWTLGGANLPVACGWMSIEILSPVSAESSKTNFGLVCLNVGLPPMSISDMYSTPIGNNQCNVGFKVKNTSSAQISPTFLGCPAQVAFQGTVCNGKQECVSIAMPVNNARTPGGEDIYDNYVPQTILDFKKSPFTLKLHLRATILAQSSAIMGNDFSMTKALTCPVAEITAPPKLQIPKNLKAPVAP